MQTIPTYTVVINNSTGEELLTEEDMTLSLPEQGEIRSLEGTALSIADEEYSIVKATTEPKLNQDHDMIAAYVFLRVEKKAK